MNKKIQKHFSFRNQHISRLNEGNISMAKYTFEQLDNYVQAKLKIQIAEE